MPGPDCDRDSEIFYFFIRLAPDAYFFVRRLRIMGGIAATIPGSVAGAANSASHKPQSGSPLIRSPEKIMIRCLLLLSVLAWPCTLFAENEPTAAPQEPAGMQRIFNGKDLSGWEGDPRLWSVRDGVIHVDTTAENPAKGNTFIIWREGKLKDFDLRLSFRCNATNNSGIQYRSKHITDGKVSNAWVVRGYQHEIRNENKLPSVSGFIYDEGGKRGRLCLVGEKATWEPSGKKVINDSLIDQAGFEKLFKLDDWNDVVIVAKGNHIRHYMNGRLILDFTDNDPELALSEGILALQLHAGKPMWAEYKNIRIAEISPSK